MKINNNYNILKLNNINFKAKAPENSENYEHIEAIYIPNPEFFKAINRVEKNFKVLISPNNSKPHAVVIKPEDIKKYLTQNGRITIPLIRQFKSVYTTVEEKLTEENNNAIKRYPKGYSDRIKFYEFMPRNFAQGLDDAILKYHIEKIPKIANEAYEKTIRLFQLSKTSDGYDFSELDEKLKSIDLLNTYVELEIDGRTDRYYDRENVFEEFIKATKEDGRANLNYLNTALSIAKNCEFGFYPEELIRIINLVKNYSKKDTENIDNIIKVIIELYGSYLSSDLDYKQNYMEAMLDLCYKDEKFEPESASKLCEFISNYDNWQKNILDKNGAENVNFSTMGLRYGSYIQEYFYNNDFKKPVAEFLNDKEDNPFYFIND